MSQKGQDPQETNKFLNVPVLLPPPHPGVWETALGSGGVLWDFSGFVI